MKTPLLLTVIIANLIAVSLRADLPPEPIDSCGPTFKEIFDFEVGDVYQYKNSYGYDCGYVDTIVKYTIKDKTIVGDKLIYKIEGIKNYCKIDCWDVEWKKCKDYQKYRAFSKTLTFIDSSKHHLNQCHNELVRIDHWLMRGDTVGYYTYVNYYVNGADTIKELGGYDNWYTFDRNGEFLVLASSSNSLSNGTNYLARYQNKLGCTYISVGNGAFEYGSSSILQGYIKNGDTTGIITPDEDLTVSVDPITKNPDIMIYPNPTDGIVHMNFHGLFSGDFLVEVIDMAGKPVSSQICTEPTVDLSGLQKGMYMLKIMLGSQIICKKLVKN